MAYKLGLEGKLYTNTGSYGTPVWDEVTNVDDLTTDIETDEAETTNRSSGGWETILPAIHKATIEFGMMYDPADADYLAMRTAHLARTLKEYAVADGTIGTTGTQYLRLHAYITKFGRTEQLKEAMKTPVKMRPGYSTNANPAWVTVT